MAFPVVDDVLPNVDSAVSENTILQFSVTDADNNLVRIAVNAIYSSGDQEVVYDGSAFAARYLANSTLSAITNGYRFRVLRAGKWPEAPMLRVLAIDAGVNIVEQDLKWSTFAGQKPLTSFPESSLRGATIGSSVVAQELREGLLLPFGRDGKGDFAHAGGTRLIGANIRQILGTICSSGQGYGELEWMPEFGSLLDRIRHAPATEATLALARLRVVDALRNYEPRVKILTAKCEYALDADGRYALQIHLTYDVLNAKDGGVIVSNVSGTIQ
jgi:phage baseplate assembly protein W